MMTKLRSCFPAKSRRQNPYSDEDLENAIMAVLRGTLNPTRASKMYRIPRQTIILILSRWKELYTEALQGHD